MVVKQTQNMVSVVIVAIIVISLLFTSATSFFPNWSTVSGIPDVVVTAMPFLSLLLFLGLMFAVIGLTNKGRN